MRPRRRSSYDDRLDLHLQLAPHTYHKEGKVHFGDNVMLIHHRSGGALANDLCTEIGGGSKEFACMVSRKSAARQPVARNVWVITRPPAKKGGDPVVPNLKPVAPDLAKAPEPLKWGEPFMLMANPALRLDPRTNMLKTMVYLSSEQQNITKKVSQVSGNQLVCCDHEAGFATTCWKAEPWVDKAKAHEKEKDSFAATVSRANEAALFADPGDAFVDAGERMVLRHCQTNHPLSAEETFPYETEGFGPELEVCCLLKGSKEQQKDPPTVHPLLPRGTATKPKKPNMVWHVQLAACEADAIDRRNLPDRITDPELLIKKIREILVKRNPEFGIRAIGMKFRQADDDKSGELNAEELKEALDDLGVFLDMEQLTNLIANMDTSGDGEINYNEFLVKIRGPMNQRRCTLVMKAYAILDADGSGEVTTEDIAEAYDVSMHPKFITGEKTKEEILAEFMDQWETDEKDGIVTKKEFLTYYADVSASIDEDDYFELMMRNAWHIAGGEGQTANTSNLRVLVSFTDGRPDEVICVENDLGVKATDTAKIIQRLTKQGVENIKGVSTG